MKLIFRDHFYFALTCAGIISVILFSCSNKSKVPVENTPSDAVSEIADTSAGWASANREITVSEPAIFIDNNYPPLIAVLSLLQTDTSITHFMKNNFCWGDCCGKSETYMNQNTGELYYLFDIDCGEYGGGNTQFYFRHDSIIMARTMETDIVEWPSDSTESQFEINETVWDLRGKAALIKTKIFKNESSNSDKLSTIPYTTNTGAFADIDSLLKEKYQHEKLLESGTDY